MINTKQNWKKVVGLEPMSEEEFRAFVEKGLDEAESGELIPAKEVFANLERRYGKGAGIYHRVYQNG